MDGEAVMSRPLEADPPGLHREVSREKVISVDFPRPVRPDDGGETPGSNRRSRSRASTTIPSGSTAFPS